MNDKDFLQWIHDRLINRHGEHELSDYMIKLRNIIAGMNPEATTLSQPATEPPPPLAHNPGKLTPSQVGEGWRLLTVDEVAARVKQRSTKEIEGWCVGVREWSDSTFRGDSPDVTYRTKKPAGYFLKDELEDIITKSGGSFEVTNEEMHSVPLAPEGEVYIYSMDGLCTWSEKPLDLKAGYKFIAHHPYDDVGHRCAELNKRVIKPTPIDSNAPDELQFTHPMPGDLPERVKKLEQQMDRMFKHHPILIKR